MPGTPRPLIRVYVLDIDRNPIPNATVKAVPFRFPRLRRSGPRLLARTFRFLCGLFGRPPCDCARPLKLNDEWGLFTAPLEPGMYTVRVSVPGSDQEPQTRDVRVTRRGLRAVFVLAPPGTPYYYRGRTRVPYRFTWNYGVAVKSAYRDRSLEQLAAQSDPPVDLGGLQYQAIDGDADFFKDDHGIRLYQAKDGATFERRVRSIGGVEHAGLIVRQSSKAVSFLTDEFVFRLRSGAEIPEVVRNSGFETRLLRRKARLWAVRATTEHSAAMLDLCNRVAALADDVTSGVMWAEPSLFANTVPLTGVGLSDPNALRTQQPHHVLLRTEQAWQVTTGSFATIAVIDRGCDQTHPFINVQASYDFVEGRQALPPNPHGTACCGLAAGLPDFANNYSGVAPGATLIAARRSYGSDIHFADVFLWCGQLDTAQNIPQCPFSADVISCSWDLDDVEPAGAIKTALDDLWAKNVVVVFSSGNDGKNFAKTAAGAMAAYSLNIAVGSSSTIIDKDGGGAAIAPPLSKEHRVKESNFGPELDLVAPGGGLLRPTDGTTQASAPGGGYGLFAETSCACPQVAGVVALIQSAYREARGLALGAPALTAQQVRDVLTSSTDQIPDAGAYLNRTSGDCGFGRVNAVSAVNQVVQNGPAITQIAGPGSTPLLEYDYQFELE